MIYDKYTVAVFMKAWFDKDFSQLSSDDFKIVYGEYMDASGLFLSDDFEKQGYIYHLNARINYVKIFLRLQREFIKDFSQPFTRDFERFKHYYGYVLKWQDNLDDFEYQLHKVEIGQKKFESILEAKIKELHNLRKGNKFRDEEHDDEESLQKSRVSFIRMLNSLGKIGFKVDKFVTTVEELALMIKQQFDEIEERKNSQYAR